MKLALFSLLFFQLTVHAEIAEKGQDRKPIDKAPTELERQRAYEYNQHVSGISPVPSEFVVDRQVGEFEKQGYVVVSAHNQHESGAVKKAIAKNLPKGVTLVVLQNRGTPTRAEIESFFGDSLNPKRLALLNVNSNGRDFWVRDHAPIPVWHQGNELGLVDYRYFRNYNADPELARGLKANLVATPYLYEGGNFMTDGNGTCVHVNSSRVPPKNVLREIFGCETIVSLPRAGGIGHIDERIKFVNKNTVLTDTVRYRDTLERAGYDVHMLPRISGKGTYANSLLLNGTAFMPIYALSTDNIAKRTYEELGFKVVPVNTYKLSYSTSGSIHCLTATYPKVSRGTIASIFGGTWSE